NSYKAITYSLFREIQDQGKQPFLMVFVLLYMVVQVGTIVITKQCCGVILRMMIHIQRQSSSFHLKTKHTAFYGNWDMLNVAIRLTQAIDINLMRSLTAMKDLLWIDILCLRLMKK